MIPNLIYKLHSHTGITLKMDILYLIKSIGQKQLEYSLKILNYGNIIYIKMFPEFCS